MPIHFKCRTCKRRLSVGSHKAGSDAQCPNCGATIRIPTKADLVAMSAMAGGSTADQPPPDLDEFRFEDDPAATSAAPPVPRETAVEQIDPEYLSVSRRVIYAQGILIATVALFCFVLGYLAGVGTGPAASGGGAAQKEPTVTMAGKLFYQPRPGESTPDDGAVMILLPQGSTPDELVPTAGLRPSDPPPADDDRAVMAIRSLGGVYVRTGADGSYNFVLPKAGKYHLLRMSKNAVRAPGADPTVDDMDGLNQFFAAASELLGQQKYTWTLVQVTAETKLAYDFGPTGG